MQKQFLALIEYILPKIDHGDKAAVTLGYGIYRKALEDNFQLEHVKKELYGIREEDDKYGHTTDRKEEIPWEKNDTYSQIQREPGEWILDDDQKKERLVENAFGMEMQKEADQEKRTLGTLWKKILICGICGVTLLAAAAAKKYGILPGVSTEVFLGMIAAGMAAGMVLFWAVKKIKRGLEVSKEKKERDIMRRKKVSDPRNTNFLYGDKKDDFGDFREIKRGDRICKTGAAGIYPGKLWRNSDFVRKSCAGAGQSCQQGTGRAGYDLSSGGHRSNWQNGDGSGCSDRSSNG